MHIKKTRLHIFGVHLNKRTQKGTPPIILLAYNKTGKSLYDRYLRALHFDFILDLSCLYLKSEKPQTHKRCEFPSLEDQFLRTIQFKLGKTAGRIGYSLANIDFGRTQECNF